MIARIFAAFLFGFVLFLANSVSSQNADEATPVTRIDHFFAEYGALDEMLTLLQETLELPEAWPMQDFGSFASGAVSLGNVSFEVVRFGQSDADRARFRGIALEPAGDTEALVGWLSERGIEHGQPRPFPPEGTPMWENTSLPGLIPETTYVFVCDYKYRAEVLASQESSQAALGENDGGPLGLIRARELVVESTDLERSRKAWSDLGLSVNRDGEALVVEFESGPVVRIRQGPENRFSGLVLDVRSLDEAAGFLRENDLLGDERNGTLTLSPDAVADLNIILVEP